jgi:hypothetical protein
MQLSHSIQSYELREILSLYFSAKFRAPVRVINAVPAREWSGDLDIRLDVELDAPLHFSQSPAFQQLEDANVAAHPN